MLRPTTCSARYIAKSVHPVVLPATGVLASSWHYQYLLGIISLVPINNGLHITYLSTHGAKPSKPALYLSP